MSLKLKVLGMGLLALAATSALAVMNASATVNGHFTNDAANGHALIVGSETGPHTAHSLRFQRTEPTGTNTGAPIECTIAKYSGTVNAATVESITITPTYELCATTEGDWGEVDVTTNGCTYTFRSTSAASTEPPTHHATVSVVCPVDEAIEVHHPNCTITVPSQTLTGVTYKTDVQSKKHAITLNVTATHIKGEFHGGICIFLGTNKEFDMTGAATVVGQNTAGEAVNITAT
jgi:hypothetical protein